MVNVVIDSKRPTVTVTTQTEVGAHVAAGGSERMLWVRHRTGFAHPQLSGAKYAVCDAYAVLQENESQVHGLFKAVQEESGGFPAVPADPFAARESNPFLERAYKSHTSFQVEDIPLQNWASKLKGAQVTKKAVEETAHLVTLREGVVRAMNTFESVSLVGTAPADMLRKLVAKERLNAIPASLEFEYFADVVKGFNPDSAAVGARAGEVVRTFLGKNIHAADTMVIGTVDTAPKLFIPETRNILMVDPGTPKDTVIKALYADQLWMRLDGILLARSWFRFIEDRATD